MCAVNVVCEGKNVLELYLVIMTVGQLQLNLGCTLDYIHDCAVL